MTPDQWKTIRRLVQWLNTNNGTSPHETAMRLMKLTEETGEVMSAYIGMTGQNPRKGITHTPGDVAEELCDVIITAAVALYSFADHPGILLDTKLARIADRASDAGARDRLSDSGRRQIAGFEGALHGEGAPCSDR